MVKPAQPNLPTPDEMLSAEFHSDDLEACWLPKYSPAELCEAQLADLSLGKLLTWIEADGSPTVAELYLCPPEVKRFWLAKKHLMLQKWCFVLQMGGNYSTIPTHGAKVIVRGSIGWLP